MNRYAVLLQVIDQLRNEAPPEYRTYYPNKEEVEKLTAARAKAFIHLILKVYFGLLTFKEREQYITDGAEDGGIDAYFIDRASKTIFFMQSKYRQNEKNFEEKGIEPEELLRMDIDRILRGEKQSESGIPYNEKIQAMTREISTIEGIGRYQNRVIILANAKGITRQKLSLLTGGFPTELIDYQACYSRLLFPLVSGTYFSADELNLSMTLSNKNAGAKISYTVQTQHAKVEITVVFVPTVEIAKTMFKYRNSILRYNPRSYLEHEGQSVNRGIRSSIENRTSNEFALFNNGITVLSDETHLNERIGQKDRAQLTLMNPQIINGGQTAYTLSQIYKENLHRDLDSIFGEKEVLVKIITFDSGVKLDDKRKLELIDDISRATNSQTTVTTADRRSNESELQEVQKQVFETLGILLERKRGEFADGIREGYLNKNQIAERSLFLRAALTAQRRLTEASGRKVAAKCNYRSILEVPEETFLKYRPAYAMLDKLQETHGRTQPRLRFSSVAKVHMALLLAKNSGMTSNASLSDYEALVLQVHANWKRFVKYVEQNFRDPRYIAGPKDKRYFSIDRMFKIPETDDKLLEAYLASEKSPSPASETESLL